MALLRVNFTFHTGLKHKRFFNVRLSGSWDATGRFSNQWSNVPMALSPDWTGCDAFTASVSLDDTQVGAVFQWGVIADIASAPNTWVVPTEVPDENSSQRYRSFVLAAGATQQDYWFVTGRRFGARKYFQPALPDPGIHFAVWAPHAKEVEVVFAPISLAGGAAPTGYISDDGAGVDRGSPVVPLVATGGGIWESNIGAPPALADFGGYLDRLYKYDSDPNIAPANNVWYWYEGQPTDYPKTDGGYLNNGSSGYTPRFSEENVCQMFTSSAAALLDDFHIDGLRVDLTDAIHRNNTLNANGASVRSANLYGIKFLRELARTVKMVNPAAFLIAEDHTSWDNMTQSPDTGGGGFDAVWYADFYHHLIGDGDYGDNYAKLLKNAGYGTSGPLNMDYFAGVLLRSTSNKICYHENHDEAGNDKNTERTIVTAVNYAPLAGATRKYAESRCRFAFGLSALSGGTPMFLMGEEIGARKFFLYDTFFQNKEDLIGDRRGIGQFLFRFYQDLIKLVTSAAAARSRTLDVIYTHNDNRVIGFVRSAPSQKLLVLASLNDAAFASGYVVGTDASRLDDGGWQEIFNSDAASYGGDNMGNGGATLQVNGGQINAVIPAHGFVVLEKVS
jgi:1,4-alpha-glucan branching enzyme